MSVSFNGVTFPLAKSEVGTLPSHDKVVEFPGTDGVEVLPMGKGAREIVVHGVTTGSPTRAALEALMDDETHSLSVEGDSYGECRCVGVGPWRFVTCTDGLRRYFAITFRQEKPD